MFTPESYGFTEYWNLLQEPSRPRSFPAAYLLLLAAIDTGWKIENPVKTALRQDTSGLLIYIFILRLAQKLPAHELCVPQGIEVEGFIRDEGLLVIHPYGQNV